MNGEKSRVDKLLDSVEKKAALLHCLSAELRSIRFATVSEIGATQNINKRLHEVAKLVKSMQGDATSAYTFASFKASEKSTGKIAFVFCATCDESIDPKRSEDHKKDGHDVEEVPS